VSIGMVAAAGLAVKLELMDKADAVRLKKLLQRAGLMTALPPLEIAPLLQAMRYDKKVQGGKIRFVLPRAIGQVFITDDVNPAAVESVLGEMR
jgi:3-dehydroquinate synthase